MLTINNYNFGYKKKLTKGLKKMIDKTMPFSLKDKREKDMKEKQTTD